MHRRERKQNQGIRRIASWFEEAVLENVPAAGPTWRFLKREGRGVKNGWTLFLVMLVVVAFATNKIDRVVLAPRPPEIKNLHPYTEPQFFGLDYEGNLTLGIFFGVINSGPPTVLQGFDATFKFRDATFDKIGPALIPDNQEHVRFTVSGQPMFLRRSDMLYEKVINTIPTGGLMQGYVIYVMKGVSLESVKEGFYYTVFFRDASDNEYQTSSSSVKFRDPNHLSGLHPGMGNPMAPFADWESQIPTPQPPPTLNTGTSPH